jgi:hypothetical protein
MHVLTSGVGYLIIIEGYSSQVLVLRLVSVFCYHFWYQVRSGNTGRLTDREAVIYRLCRDARRLSFEDR